jgi:uncharacterized membrane protein
MLLLLGLVLILGAGTFTGLVIGYNTTGGPDYTVTMFGNTLGTLNSLEILVAGLVLALIFCIGLVIAGFGTRMRRARMAEYRAARDILTERNARARATAATPAPAAPAPTAPTSTDTSDTTPSEVGTARHGGRRRLTFHHS